MSSKIESKLGFGPMSPEIIEGIIKASSKLRKPFMLISTKNQIDWNGGYVNKWTTKQYVGFVNKMRGKHMGSKIYLCRDHCGPGFKNDSIDDIYKTIDDDIKNNFDLIHIDFSKFSSDKKVVLDKTRKVIEWIIKKNNEIKIEIGTEENIGEYKDKIEEIISDFNFIKKFVSPEFFVIQTGSLVREINQVGSFNKKFISEIHEFLLHNDVKLKEHNADYLNFEMIKERKGIVDAMNVAPQLGVIQTETIVNEALIYGIDINPFLECSYKSKAWEKWLYKNTYKNKMLCSIIAGHYNFISDEYKELVFKLEKYINIKKLIIDKIIDLAKYYSDAFDS